MDAPVVQPVPPQQPKNNLHIFINIFIFFLGILVGMMIDKTTLLSTLRIPYLTATPTPLASPKPTAEAGDPTANWKTFKNDTYEIKYPDNFRPFYSLSDSSFVDILGSTQNIDIQIYTNNQFNISIPVEDWAKKNNEELLDKQINIGGNEAIITRKKYNLNDISLKYIIVRAGNIIYTFSISILNYDDNKAQLVDQILSTFEFIQ